MNRLQAAEKRYANLKYLWQQAEKEVATLKVQNADLVAALEAAKFWMEGQHSTVSGDCSVCGSESPYHHGQCPKAQVDQALGGE